jgi:hypothetical protein
MDDALQLLIPTEQGVGARGDFEREVLGQIALLGHTELRCPCAQSKHAKSGTTSSFAGYHGASLKHDGIGVASAFRKRHGQTPRNFCSYSLRALFIAQSMVYASLFTVLE